MRTPLLAGNWKMHLSLAESDALAAAVVAASASAPDREVMIAPPFTALVSVGKILAGSAVRLAAQNVCWADKGAFTGEISPVMLKEAGCTMAIVGHSERRHVFGETDALINRRIVGSLAHGLVPIVCIGETLNEREEGRTLAVLETQLRSGLDGVRLPDPQALVVAYEPVWAIGTGRTATVEQAQEAHAFIRTVLAALFEKNIATGIRVLYGGSVSPDNIDALMGQADVDGALVGGASLKAEAFTRIVHYLRQP